MDVRHVLGLVRMLHEGVTIEREGFFVVKAREPEHADFVLIHTTSTMLAYNDWGGGKPLPRCSGRLRRCADTDFLDAASRRAGVVAQTRGCSTQHPHRHPGNRMDSRHPPYEWAWVNGYSRHHADAFWATYERPFTVWAEEQGFRVTT